MRSRRLAKPQGAAVRPISAVLLLDTSDMTTAKTTAGLLYTAECKLSTNQIRVACHSNGLAPTGNGAKLN